MAERKNFQGDRTASMDYLGAARQALMILKNEMSFNRLTSLSRVIDLPGGVRIQVSSIFGQDNIMIYAPPAIEARVIAQVARELPLVGEAAPGVMPEFSAMDFADTVSRYGQVTVLITRSPPAYQVAVPAKVICAGGIFPGAPTPVQPFVYSTDGGLKILKVDPSCNGGEVMGLSPDGVRAYGLEDLKQGITSNLGHYVDTLAVRWSSTSAGPTGPLVSDNTFFTGEVNGVVYGEQPSGLGHISWGGVPGSQVFNTLFNRAPQHMPSGYNSDGVGPNGLYIPAQYTVRVNAVIVFPQPNSTVTPPVTTSTLVFSG